MKLLLILFSYYIQLSCLSSQKYILDSSFGDKGSFKFNFQKSTNFGGIITKDNKEIFLFGSNLLYYLDSTGIKLNLGSRSNPDTFNIGLYDLIPNSITQSDSINIFFGLSGNTKIGSGIKYRNLNINQINDNSFDELGSINVVNDVDFSPGFGRSGEKYLMVVSNYKSDGVVKTIKLFRINAIGGLDSSIYLSPEICSIDDCAIGFSNIIQDSNGSLFFGFNYLNSDSAFIDLVKLNSDYTLDSEFGDKGFLRIHSERFFGSQSLFLEKIIFNNLDDIYLFLGQDDNTIIKKMFNNGKFDDSFANNGEFRVEQTNPHRLSMLYQNEQDDMLFFVYHNITQKSKLYCIDSDGILKQEYEQNGGFVLDGYIVDFKPFGSNQFLVLESSDIPFNREMKLNRIVQNPISNEDNNNYSSSLDVFPNPNSGEFSISLQSLNSNELNYNIINSYGELIEHGKLAKSDANSDKYIKFINVIPGVYFLQLTIADKRITKRIVISAY